MTTFFSHNFSDILVKLTKLRVIEKNYNHGCISRIQYRRFQSY